MKTLPLAATLLALPCFLSTPGAYGADLKLNAASLSTAYYTPDYVTGPSVSEASAASVFNWDGTVVHGTIMGRSFSTPDVAPAVSGTPAASVGLGSISGVILPANSAVSTLADPIGPASSSLASDPAQSFVAPADPSTIYLGGNACANAEGLGCYGSNLVATGANASILASPVAAAPEPPSLIFLATGLLGLLAVRVVRRGSPATHSA